MVIAGAEPFYFAGGATAVLLVHGFTGSPSEMRLYGEALAREGFTVLAVRLAGHGTMPEDMERTTAEDWMDAVLDGYALLSSDARIERIAVAGLSMGALLALGLSMLRKVWRVVSVAAPIFIQEERELSMLPPREACPGIFQPKRTRALPVEPRYRIGYTRMPLLSIHELLAVIAKMKDALPEVTAPLLVIQGGEDRTVKPESARYIMERAGSAQKRLVMLPRAGHRLVIGVERERAFAETIAFLRED